MSRKRQNRQSSVASMILLGIILFLAAGAGAFYWANRKETPTTHAIPPTVKITQNPKASPSEVTIFLAVPAKGRMLLKGQTRSVDTKDGILDVAVRTLFEAGSHDHGSGAFLPEGVKLLKPVIVEGDTAIIDLSQEFIDNFCGGSDQEEIALNAIAQTVTHTQKGVRRVRILVGGKPVDSLGGHFDLSEPIVPDPELVKPD